MKVVQINTTCGVGSTGKICVGVSRLLTEEGIENYILYSTRSNGYEQGIACTDRREQRMQAAKSRLLGNYGFNSKGATKRMIANLERIQPDVVHLHNIHGHDCDLDTLCAYLKSKRIRVFWTFHDCWAFTGYCPHFTMVGCDHWKTGCHHCPQRREYSWLWDCSGKNYRRKQAALDGLDLTVVTPSRWLADVVGESFLRDCPVRVIHNGIDLSVFRPTESDFREKHGLTGKRILLGVAFGWDERKGLDVFIELARRLPDSYRIVLVGTDDRVDRMLPDSILSIHRTQDQRELAEIYSAADLFVNPTREENYPTVNMESLACGTPILTFRTGGSPEILDETCGAVVERGDVDALEAEILRICDTEPYSAEACLTRAAGFDLHERFREYVHLYVQSRSATHI